MIPYGENNRRRIFFKLIKAEQKIAEIFLEEKTMQKKAQKSKKTPPPPLQILTSQDICVSICL